jgi:hypothetical protein
MRIVLDECVPSKLARYFVGHEVTTVANLGWTGVRNGQLLAKVEVSGYDLLVTVDKNLRHQQKIEGRTIAVLVLDAFRNTVAELVPHVERALPNLSSMVAGQVYIY